ncbi:DUF202 domain-containing protein [Actinopolymorpha alba]|uniref:DUF202 domain-containing protein n=1 Tax=Actinopolymorpha alba TaxID=533267 RepID=UPI0003749513|nr:DUF202 domain-containing protein [Actinopolymorpha alba]
MHDEAAQLERTALAWSRTALALAVNGALLVRSAEASGEWAAVAGIGLLAVTLPVWIVTSRAYQRLKGGPAAALLARGGFTVGAAALAVVVGVLDLAAVVTHR